MTISTISQLELLDNVIPKTTVTEISHTDATAIYMVLQYILKVVACEVINNKQTFAFALHKLFFIAQLPFLNLDIVFLGKVSQSFRIRHLLVFHDEVHRVSTFATRKAFAKPFGGRNVKRRCLVTMKRTQTDVIDTTLAQGDKI